MFWSSKTLEEQLGPPEKLIFPYEEEHIDCAAYQLAIGSEVYISPEKEDTEPARSTVRLLETDEPFCIPSGQFAFLLTKERVRVPKDALALISIRAKVKFHGLVNVSGFHVDPGYDGQLMFAVFNAGPVPVHLKEGQRIFLIWYASLDVRGGKTKDKARPDGMDMDVIAGIAGQVPSMAGLAREVRRVGERVHDVEKQQRVVQTLLTLFAGGAVAWFIRGLFM